MKYIKRRLQDHFRDDDLSPTVLHELATVVEAVVVETLRQRARKGGRARAKALSISSRGMAASFDRAANTSSASVGPVSGVSSADSSTTRHVSSSSSMVSLADLRLGGLTLALPHRGLANGVVDVAIRPESVRLTPSDGTDVPVAGTILKVAYLGSHMEYTVGSVIGELFAVESGVAKLLAVGAKVSISFTDYGVSVVGRDRSAADAGT